jgi:hypothetical protein
MRQRAPAAAPRASGRSTLAVQANLFGRLTRVARSYTFFYGDSAGAHCGVEDSHMFHSVTLSDKVLLLAQAVKQ